MTATPFEPAAILVDLDGTLVDTTYLHTICWWRALADYGHVVPMAAIHRSVGMGDDTLLDHLLPSRRDRGLDAAVIAAHAAEFATWQFLARPLPGARQLLARLKDLGLKVVIATSASPESLAVLRRALDADHHLDAVTTASEASTGKPSPDLVQAALARVGVAAPDAVFLGDAVWDIEAAGRAGVPCIGLESGGTSAAELRAAGAIETWRDPADLVAHLPASRLMDLVADRVAVLEGGA